jgi:predicted site-specific integrase-resolvase
MLGCSVTTLRRWDEGGKLVAVRTPGGKRRYLVEALEAFQGKARKLAAKSTVVAAYCRVSSNEQKQKGDLERQKGRVLEYCVKRGYHVQHILEEVGSGMNDNRPKLHRLFDLAIAGEIGRVVIEHKDRFTRFNSTIFVKFLQSHGVEVEWMEDVLPKSYEAEIVEDMMSLIASFSAKVYGRRSAGRRKKKLDTVEAAE